MKITYDTLTHFSCLPDDDVRKRITQIDSRCRWNGIDSLEQDTLLIHQALLLLAGYSYDILQLPNNFTILSPFDKLIHLLHQYVLFQGHMSSEICKTQWVPRLRVNQCLDLIHNMTSGGIKRNQDNTFSDKSLQMFGIMATVGDTIEFLGRVLNSPNGESTAAKLPWSCISEKTIPTTRYDKIS